MVSDGILVAEMHAFYRKEAAGGSMCMAPSGCLPCICLILVFSLTSSFFAFCHCLFFHSSGASHVRANIEPCTPQSSERQITRVNIPHSFFLSLLFFCTVWLFRQMMPSSSSHLPALYISTPSPWQCGNHPLHSFDASIHCGNATLFVFGSKRIIMKR